MYFSHEDSKVVADVLCVVLPIAFVALIAWCVRNRDRFGAGSSNAAHEADFGDNPACVEAPGPGNGWGSLAGPTFGHRD